MDSWASPPDTPSPGKRATSVDSAASRMHGTCSFYAIHVSGGDGADEIAREHARVAPANLDLALEDREARKRIRGAPLLTEVK